MILKSNRVLRFFSALLLFIAGSLSVFATDGNVYDDIDFKSKKQVDEGITNQLDFLIDFNAKNEKSNKSDENWYVYIVGEDTFDSTLFSDLEYVESQLDLSAIGLKNTPLDVAKLNEKLIEINKSLLEKKLPLIYYGVANKKRAIPAPFFPFEGQYNVSTTDSEKKLLSYYFEKNLKEYGQDEAIKNVNSVLWNFYKNEKDEVQEALLTKTLAKSGGSGAIALSTYYLAFIKSDGNGKAKLLWWSLTDHKHSETYFDKHPIDLGLYKQHYKSLSNSDTDKNYARINAWYNYLTGADVPDSEFLSEMLANYLNNPKCANLSTAEAEKLKKDFIAKITTGNKDEIIAFTEQLCPAIVLEVDYNYIIKAIKTITADRINEKGEAAVLVLMYGIKTKDYGSFFTDLKASENNLLNRLLVQMDDASLNPYDKDHYSSFIGQLLYMGYQNNGEYLRKERIALAEALLKYKYEIDDLNKESIDEALAKIISFNLDSGESAFEDYLVKDNYKMMLEFVNFYTQNKTSLIKSQNDSQQVLRNIADAWGNFFAERNNEEAYIKLLNIAFTSENAGFAHNIEIKDNVAKFVFRMLAHVPQEPYKLYQYFTLTDQNGNLSNLEKIIKKTSRIDYELYGQAFYEGLTKILDSQRDVKARIQIVKWAIEDDDFLNNTHENMVVNIFKNIQNKEDKELIYNFLTYKNGEKSTGEKTYEYFSKITDQGILSGSGAQTKFVDYYIGLIREGIGTVEDRIAIVRKVLSKGDDWSMLWFANDTEDLVSSLFNDLNRGDAEYVIGELKGKNNEYKLFREIWQTLQSVNVPAKFDRDNSQLLSFATSIGGLLKLTSKETLEAASHYEKYLDEHHNYLNSNPSKIPLIDGNYLPMVRANFFDYTKGNNKHKLGAEIKPEVSKNVNISLEIGGSKVMDKSFDPFEYVFVEFIEDTEVNGNVKFSKGDIIGVPAFYIAWMKGTINSQQNNVAFVVGMDAMVVVAGTLAVVYSGGTLTPFILAATKAEILFAGIHIPLTIYNKEAKETLGEDFVMGLEIAYMITSVATLPEALATLPKNLVTLRTQAGKVIDYTKGGVIAAGTKIEKITIDVKEFTRALPELLKALKNDPAKRQELFKRISDFESLMRTKMQGFGNNVPAEFRKAYDQLLELTKQFYLANIPAGLASIINKLPNDRLQVAIINKLLTYTFDGKPILGIDAQGILHHVKKYQEAENYTTIVGDFKAKVQLESGEQYEAAIEAAKNDKGDVVFRQKSGDDFVEGGDLVTDINNFQARIKAFLDDNVVKRLRKDILESDLQSKFPDLTIEELIAIKLYTNGEKRNGKVIFNTLNSQLRSGKVEEFYVGMDLLLTNSLKKLPQYNSEKVFRGVSGDEANLARTWKKGDEIDFADYKSTSEDMVMAAYYNVDNEVVYEIIDPKGASLSSISYYDNEMEVLLYRGQKFKVIDVKENFQIDEVRNLNTKKFTKITLQAADGSSGIVNTNPVKSIPEHVWPAPYPPLAAGQVRVADLQRLKLDRVTGAFQGEVKESIVNSKVEEILAILNGEATGKHLPIVKMAPDPNTPGGFVLTDQTHTYVAYKQLGFDEIPASIYNESEGIPFLIRQGAYNTEHYFPINELQTVPEFTGTPAQQATKRREAMEGRIKNETGSIESTLSNSKSEQILNSDFKEIPVSELKMMIKTDGTNGRGLTKEYADKISKTGYDVKSIEPVKIIELPDGTKVIADVESHYRAAAMVQAGGTDVPVQFMTYDELLKVSPSSKRQRELTELYFMLKVGQQTDSYKSSWLPDMSWEGEKELFYDIPTRIDNFLKAEFPNLSRIIPLRSVDELLNHVDFPQAKKSDFKDELSSSPEKAKAFGNNPDLVDAWGVLYDIEVSKEFKKQLNNVYAMDAYIKKVAKNYNNIDAESFNTFVKNQIDKDAYMKSILSTELYGGIDVSHVSLNHIKPISVKLKTPQYSGAGKFGAYEARIKNGIIERYLVGDNGVGEWRPLNGNTVDDVNFVITTDGKLRIGHGHYNISAEAQSVYSAGKLQIVNGKVTEVSNYSGHYLPPNDNLYQVEKVFRELKIISDDFKIFENPNAVKSASPTNNTTGFKYNFEKEGYVYVPKTNTEPNGTKTIEHFIEKDGQVAAVCGHSTISTDGVLENVLYVPEKLRNKDISKAIYAHVLKEDVKSIPTEYSGDEFISDNYTAFMNEYNISKDKVKAVLATPDGKVLGSEWEPKGIQVKDKEVLLVWVKKGTANSELNEPWINTLPTGLRAQLFAEKGEMYDLFKSANANERAKLAKSWEVLKNAAGLYYQPLMVIKLSTIGEKFHYNGIKGFDALKPLFTTYTTGYPDLKLLTKEMEFINKLSELESLFKSTNDLPVSFSCVKNAAYYDPVVLDGSGDVIIKVEAGNIVKNKFFDKADDSYEKVGEYNGFDILRKGDEIGFKSADIININR